MDLLELMRSAESIAREAGEILIKGEKDRPSKIETKASSMDFVTNVDNASEKLIVERIIQKFPNDSILGEEGSSLEGTTGRRWIIDPLDGTANFIHQWRVSAVSIGIEIDGVFSVGVVFNPFQDEMFTGAIGHGAYLNGMLLASRENAIKTWSTSFIGMDGGGPAEIAAERAEFSKDVIQNGGAFRPLGCTSISLCYVALGRFDAHFNRGSSIWDIAAGAVIAREVGCVVEGLEAESQPTGDLCLAAIPSVMPDLRRVANEAMNSAV